MKQQGFTLIEMAIVLVIIGLLIGGVLKGQELIENSKTKAVVSDMKAVQASYNGYIDRYKAIPGDETAATMTNRGWLGTTGGNGDGVLGITAAQTFTNAGEQAGFWRALRGSGLMTGDPAATAVVAGLPRHSGGGLLGVTTGAVYGQSGTFVCASGLSTKQAGAIDVLIDGPLPATQIGNNAGSLLGDTGAANPLPPVSPLPTPAGTAYSETAQINPWTVCMKI
jgi:prepilin-type N-terminal cleavage/methylation domain-containing protein